MSRSNGTRSPFPEADAKLDSHLKQVILKESLESTEFLAVPTSQGSVAPVIGTQPSTTSDSCSSKANQSTDLMDNVLEISGEYFVKPNKTVYGLMNGSERDVGRYGGDRFQPGSFVQEQLYPGSVGTIVEEWDTRSMVEMGEFVYKINWPPGSKDHLLKKDVWYPRSTLYQFNETARMVHFVKPRNVRDMEPKCANGWTMAKFASIQVQEIFIVNGRPKRVFAKDDNEFGAWLQNCNFSNGHLEEETKDLGPEFWRLEEFDKESPISRALRSVHINALKTARQIFVRKFTQKAKKVQRGRAKLHAIRKRRISVLKQLSDSNTTDQITVAGGNQTPNTQTLQDQPESLFAQLLGEGDRSYNTKQNPDYGYCTDEMTGPPNNSPGSNLPEPPASVVCDETEVNSLLEYVKGNQLQMSPIVLQNSDSLLETPKPSSSTGAFDKVVSTQSLVPTNQTINEPVNVSSPATSSNGSRKRRNDVSPDQMDGYPESKAAYIELESKYSVLKKKHEVLKGKVELEEGRAASWQTIFLQAVTQMSAHLGVFVRENAEIRSTAVQLKDVANTINHANFEFKETENKIQNLLNKSPVGGGHVYAWLVPSNNDGNNEAHQVPQSFPFTGSEAVIPSFGNQSSQVSFQIQGDDYAAQQEITTTETPRAAYSSSYTGQQDDEIVVHDSPRNSALIIRHNRKCGPVFDFPNDEAFNHQECKKFLQMCKKSMGEPRLTTQLREKFCYWYFKDLQYDELFGVNGLQAQGKLPVPPKQHGQAKVKRDQGREVIQGEITDKEQLKNVNYPTYVPQSVEQDIVALVKSKKNAEMVGTQRKRIFFGCTRLAQALIRIGHIPFLKNDDQLVKSLNRTLFLMSQEPKANHHSKMHCSKAIPWVFAIMDCIIHNFPFLVNEETVDEFHDLPNAICENLRNVVYVARTR